MRSSTTLRRRRWRDTVPLRIPCHVPIDGRQRRDAYPQGELPLQGQETHRLIYQGGPFPFDKDGIVFGNRERLLPIQKRGYYREYTVRTPGARDRGAKRIVCGGVATAPDACFYSADHYASFRKIVP